MRKIVAVIPAYNEVAVCNVALRTKNVLEKYGDYRIFVVDDGSTDRTYEKLLSLKSEIPNLQIIRNPRNLGYGDALRRGLIAAAKEKPYCTLTIDGDGQHRPEEFDERFLEPIERDEADIVVAKPIGIRKEEHHVLKDIWRCICTYLFDIFSPSVKLTYSTGGMRAFSQKALKTINLPPYIGRCSPAELITLQAVMRGLKIVEIPTVYDERKNGKSFTSLSYPIRNIPIIGLNILIEVLRQIF